MFTTMFTYDVSYNDELWSVETEIRK